MGNEIVQLCTCKNDMKQVLEKTTRREITATDLEKKDISHNCKALFQDKNSEDTRSNSQIALNSNRVMNHNKEFIDEKRKNKNSLPDGVSYEGELKDGLHHGIGILKTKEYRYDGQFVNGMKSGKGKCEYFLLKKSYEGYWDNNLPNGEGIETNINGIIYKGSFEDGKKTGTGSLTLVNGGQYVGEFSQDACHGKGLFKWSDSKYYDGEWKSNNFDGFGIMVDGNKKYIGKFKEGLKNGYGANYYKDSKTIVLSKWLDDKILDGIALIIREDKNDQIVYFKNNQITHKCNVEDISENEEITLYNSMYSFYKEKILPAIQLNPNSTSQ